MLITKPDVVVMHRDSRQFLRAATETAHMTLLFLCAFFAALWLIGLPLYHAFFASPDERDVLRANLSRLRQDRRLRGCCLLGLFVLLNAWSLYPLRGACVAAAVIAAFVLIQS